MQPSQSALNPEAARPAARRKQGPSSIYPTRARDFRPRLELQTSRKLKVHGLCHQRMRPAHQGRPGSKQHSTALTSH
ncbi:hypothetical protein TSOC_006984 [Tetrabaena socialis]|uniref:Uncharacterized protein n=1 Tax=Tetrabaena socialis TaxID=47790 RepID=A0A2J8A294_9CHLO|nr:hypothetical protein TSOC_006984 [Tetrabaena socialis]|eukprot:PNH06637.1 hypothetical protein TSOC_006984 [Tetrabaena socialis]